VQRGEKIPLQGPCWRRDSLVSRLKKGNPGNLFKGYFRLRTKYTVCEKKKKKMLGGGLRIKKCTGHFLGGIMGINPTPREWRPTF